MAFFELATRDVVSATSSLADKFLLNVINDRARNESDYAKVPFIFHKVITVSKNFWQPDTKTLCTLADVSALCRSIGLNVFGIEIKNFGQICIQLCWTVDTDIHHILAQKETNEKNGFLWFNVENPSIITIFVKADQQ